METICCLKVAVKFNCSVCDYTTSRKSSIVKHYSTVKHSVNVSGDASDDNVAKSCKKLQNKLTYTCSNCSKIYNSRNGMWKHKQTCTETSKNHETSEPTQDLVAYLIKQNSDLQKQIIEICKSTGNMSNSQNQIHSNNKTFNLQVFLNEECKDAMNISDFVNSINLQLSDLESVGQLGYVEGISNIIIKNLKALDVTKRPVHCTDPKRETIYIKDGDVWEKDDEDNKKLRKMIKSVAFRNSKNTRLFKEKYPDCNKGDSRYSDTYNKIVIEAMGGGSKCNDRDSEDKIIRRIAKQMTIDKS